MRVHLLPEGVGVLDNDIQKRILLRTVHEREYITRRDLVDEVFAKTFHFVSYYRNIVE